MITDPKKISFETKNDVIDYVSKGLPPSKKNYDNVMKMLREGDFPGGGDNRINTDYSDAELLGINETLDRIYENRKKERNKVLGCLGILVAGVAVGCFVKGSKKKDDDISNRSDLIEVQDIEVIEI